MQSIRKLKKNISIIIFILSLSVHAGAQIEKFSYGLHLSLNYPTIGSEFGTYAGEGNPTLGMFIQYKPETGIDISHPTQNKRYTLIPDEFVRRLTFKLEPMFCINSFRHTDIDKKYSNYYLEIAGLAYVQPFTYIDEIKFFTGIRPSYLTSYSTEVFEFGAYTAKPSDANKNNTGRIDLCIPIGVSVQLSEAVSMELSYIHSLTNQNTAQIIKGRPSSIELTLNLNALGLVNQFSKKEELLRKQINKLGKGSLLIMLPTPNAHEIKTLRSEGRNEEADYIYTELRERNKKVISEFKSFFDFCPVYFFMDTSAYKVISKNFNDVFVNPDLSPNSLIHPDSSNFFVASFCDDISKYTAKHQYGLFVYDDQITQLQKPFNVPANLIGYNLEGDPLNFFKKKRYDYSKMSFSRIITKFNNRMLRYKD